VLIPADAAANRGEYRKAIAACSKQLATPHGGQDGKYGGNDRHDPQSMLSPMALFLSDSSRQLIVGNRQFIPSLSFWLISARTDRGAEFLGLLDQVIVLYRCKPAQG